MLCFLVVVLLTIYTQHFAAAEIAITDKNSISNSFDFEAVKIADDLEESHKDAKNTDDITEDDLEITAKNIAVSKNGTTTFTEYGNARMHDILANFDNGYFVRDQDKQKDFLLKIKDNVRINYENSFIIYANYILYGSNGSLHIRNAKLIDLDGNHFITKDITNYKDDWFIFKTSIFTSCPISFSENDVVQDYLSNAPEIVTVQSQWEKNKNDAHNKQLHKYTTYFDDIISPSIKPRYDYEIIPKHKSYAEIDSNFETVFDKYKFSEWHLSIDNGKYNKKTGVAIFNNVQFKVLNIPIFAMPRYTVNLKDNTKPKTGLLSPEILTGGRQIGILIPWYWRIDHNKELLVKGYLFSNSTFLFPGRPDNITNDWIRGRSNYVHMAYSHLISKENGMLSKYSIKGSITEMTQIINYDTKQALQNSDGSYQYGIRGHLRAKGFFSLSPTTNIQYKLLYITDPNYGMFYLRKIIGYHRNFISIQDTQDRSFNKAEISSWTPMVVNYQTEISPMIVPALQSSFRTKIDPLGGYFYTNNYANYIHRMQGFSRAAISDEIGYSVGNTFLGTMLNVDLSLRTNGYHTSFQSGSHTALGYSNSSNIISSMIGSYGLLMQDPIYNQYGTGLGGQNALMSHIKINHPMYQISKYGTLIIDPIISIQNNYGANYGSFTNEDSFNTRLTFSNIFEKNIVSGIDGLISGSRISAGVKNTFVTTSGFQIIVGGGIMSTLANFNTELLYKQSGIPNNGLSNYVGTVGMTSPNGRIMITNNHRINIDNGKILESHTTFTGVIIVDMLNISIGHSYINKESIFFIQKQAYDVNMLSVMLDAMITKNLVLKFSSSFSLNPFVTVVYNNNNTSNNTTVSNLQTEPWLFGSIQIMYRAGCIEYGIMFSKSIVPGTTNQDWLFGGISVTPVGI